MVRDTGRDCVSDERYLASLPNGRQRFLSVGGWEINLVTAGKPGGPRLLLLHGIGVSWRWWEPVLDELGSTFEIAAIDLPGSGRSSPLTGTLVRRDYGDLLAGVLEATGPAIVIGHSLGGYVAIQAALEEVDGIQGLFLIAPVGFGPIENRYFRALSVPGLGGVLRTTGQRGVPLLLRSLLYDRSLVDTMLCWTDASPKAREQFIFQLKLGLDNLGRTTTGLVTTEPWDREIPVSLLWGAHDSVFSLDTAQNAAQVLGSRDLTIGEGSGHFPHLEEPDLFYRALQEFVDGVLP